LLRSYVTYDTQYIDYVLRFYEKCHENMIGSKLFLAQVKTDKQLNFKILHHEKTINHSLNYAPASYLTNQ
jgi:hypothetical protein